MKKTVKRILSTALCAAVSVSVMQTALASKPATTAIKLPLADKKTTLNVLVKAHASVKDYADNKLTKYILEKTNVQLNFTVLQPGESAQKVNLILASGANMPDVFMNVNDFSNAQIVSYGAQGLFLPVDKYISTIGVEFPRVVKEMKEIENIDLMSMITAPDGKIYALPAVSINVANQHASRMWINNDWLTKLNLKLPKNTEDFYTVLKAFKTKDPNGNGKTDEIPFTGAQNSWNTKPDTLMNSFIFQGQNFMEKFQLVDGVISATFNQPAYRKGLEYLNKLVKEGLLDPGSLTQNQAQIRQLFDNKDAVLLGGFTAGALNTVTAQAGSDRNKSYVLLPPLKGPDGVQINPLLKFTVANPLGTWVITKSCKTPELAFKVADYMYSEDISLRNRYGEPGVDWNFEKPDVKAIDGTPAFYKEVFVWGGVQNIHYQATGPMYLPDRYASYQRARVTDYYDAEAVLWDATQVLKQYDKDYIVPNLMYTEDEAVVFSELNAQLTSIQSQNFARFLTGDRPLTEWDAYVKELDNAGLKKFVELMQKVYDRQFKGKK